MADDEDWEYARMAKDPENLPSPHGDVPDWFTDMDNQILYTLLFIEILSPSIIAENIDRSRSAVSQRLNILQAGGYVEKVDRGKYTLTADGAYVVTGDRSLLQSDE